MQQASVGNNYKASHFSVDISELIREAYEVVPFFSLVGSAIKWQTWEDIAVYSGKWF